MPGGTDKMTLQTGALRSTCSGTSGLGPIRFISPLITLTSCGNSSSLYWRRKAPIRVTRGSPATVTVAPCVSGTIVLNFQMPNDLPWRPTLNCLKKIGRPSAQRIRSATAASSGSKNSNPIAALALFVSMRLMSWSRLPGVLISDWQIYRRHSDGAITYSFIQRPLRCINWRRC